MQGQHSEIIRQGNATQEDWAALLSDAERIGAHVLPFVAEGDIGPTYLSQQDFLSLAGEDTGLANKAWMAALAQRRSGVLQFASPEKGILTGGLAFKPFAERVGLTQRQIDGRATEERRILRDSFGRVVTPEVFGFWKKVITSFTQSPDQGSGAAD